MNPRAKAWTREIRRAQMRAERVRTLELSKRTNGVDEPAARPGVAPSDPGDRLHVRWPGVAVTTSDEAGRFVVHRFERPRTVVQAQATFRAAARLHASEVQRAGGLHGRIEVEVAELCWVWAPVHDRPCADGGDGGRCGLWAMTMQGA